MQNMIYADNAATTRLDKCAFEAMIPWLTDEYANASQPYSFSRKPKKALAEARAAIAECINAKPEEIVFTSCGTESDNWVIKSPLLMEGGRKGIVTSAFEHHAVLNSCKMMESLGFNVAYVSPDTHGYIQKDTFAAALDANTGLASVMFANNELGTVQPIGALCALAHCAGALFHTDGVQAVGHIPIDVKALDVDMLSSSAHKFNGPKGIGFLYIKKGLQLPPLIDGGAQENGRRAGTENIASIVGMAAALKNNCAHMEENRRHLTALEGLLISRLKSKEIAFRLNGGEDKLPGLLSLSFAGLEGEAILHRMDLMGIYISTGSACDSKNTQISHVLKAIKLDPLLAKGTIRISLGKYNTEDEVCAIADALEKIVKK